MINDGKNMVKKQNSRQIRRIRFDKRQIEAVNRLKISSMDGYVRDALYEKLERDFKIKFTYL
jgi:hypothetical protein